MATDNRKMRGNGIKGTRASKGHARISFPSRPPDNPVCNESVETIFGRELTGNSRSRDTSRMVSILRNVR